MKKRTYFGTVYLVIILTGLLVVSSNVTAQTTAQMTPLEKKLYEAGLKEGRFEWWDSLSLKEASAFIKEFSNKYPGIKVEFAEYIGSTREEKYLAEYSAGRKTMDLTSLDRYNLFREKNLLLELADIVKDVNYPSQFCAKDFTGVSVEHVILATSYNTKLVSPKDVPKSYGDLLDPKWKGKKISVNTEMKLFYYLSAIWGQDKTINYMKKLGQQDLIFTKGSSATMTLLGTGEFPIAMSVNLHGTLRDKGKGAPVDFVPLDPAIDKLSPWVIMREAPHPNAAKLFLRWCVSPEGQQVVDKVRNKGNPLPGFKTTQSKAIEKMGLKVTALAGWEVEAGDLLDLEILYSDALGLKRK